jgi:hypothetical protein
MNKKTNVNKITKEGWLQKSKKENRELFSEFDVLLRALDRFFVIENIPPSKSAPGGKNFYGELNAIKEVIVRVLAILDKIIPERDRNVYWFHKFAESKLLTTRERARIKEDMYMQDTPEKSLYVMYDSFINLKSIIADILQNSDIRQLSFKNIGQLISKALHENVFFSPFLKKMDPELDFIDNKTVSNIVKGLKDKESRKIASVMFLYLFRFLRYMSHIDQGATRSNSLNRSIVILVLIRSEIDMFHKYMKNASEKIKDDAFRMLIKGLSYQFSMETKRVYQQELNNIFDKKSSRQLRGNVENSHGILKNLTLQAIVQLSKFWNTDVKDEEVFEIFITRAGQSIKLRDDLYVLHRIIGQLEKTVDDKEKRDIILATLSNYLDYFESFTFKLLRYDDYGEFSNLVNSITSDYKKGEDFQKILDKCHQLDVLIVTTLRQIENREELKGQPIDIEKSEELVRQYLPIRKG